MRKPAGKTDQPQDLVRGKALSGERLDGGVAVLLFLHRLDRLVTQRQLDNGGAVASPGGFLGAAAPGRRALWRLAVRMRVLERLRIGDAFSRSGCLIVWKSRGIGLAGRLALVVPCCVSLCHWIPPGGSATRAIADAPLRVSATAPSRTAITIIPLRMLQTRIQLQVPTHLSATAAVLTTIPRERHQRGNAVP